MILFLKATFVETVLSLYTCGSECSHFTNTDVYVYRVVHMNKLVADDKEVSAI